VSHNPKIAFVQDALPVLGGAERVLAAAWEVYPEAPLYTLLYSKDAFENSSYAEKTLIPSFVNRLPGAKTRYRNYLPLMPLAVERFDLREFDIILSFSYAVAHGILPRPDQLHISYTYTPLRYAWHFYHQFLQEKGLRSGLRGWLVQIILHYMRFWDRAAAGRVDRFVAPSQWVAQGIWRSYRRLAEVIYPPVDTDRFSSIHPRQDFYLTVSRLVPQKKVDLLVEAYSRLGSPLIVVGDGPEYRRLSKMASANVKLLGRRSDQEVAELMGKAKAFIQAAEEDFGIAIVEAQAAGCPVIAYGSGGGQEIVIPGRTGIFYQEQTVDSIVAAVEQFEAGEFNFEGRQIAQGVERFSKANFQEELKSLVADTWTLFQSGERNRW
jgi:glycosyltransferase involved in cell wall biosynthesis